jgi:hypothetical protein
MLYRNNLTLSALSNRLNLGTRSLVLTTGVNNNGTALRIRHTHHDVMRTSMERHYVTSIPVGVYAIPPITGPAAADAARFKKACVDSWKPDAADARLVPTPTATWQGWHSGRLTSGQGSGQSQSSRSRLSAAGSRIVESRRRPSASSLGAVERTRAAWATSRAEAARQAARAAVAE